MYLSSVEVINIQSHKQWKMDLPEQGLVRITGPNSAGKSIILKLLRYFLDNGIIHPKTRAGLITRDCTFGETIYTRSDGAVLTLHVTVDASTTYVKLVYQGGEPIVRYLADRNYLSLIKDFGFHYNEDRDVSLNIGEGDKSILFFTTSPKANDEVLSEATADASASATAEHLEQLLSDSREMRNRADSNLKVLDNALHELKDYDTDTIREELVQLQRWYNFLSAVYIPIIPEILPVPRVHSISVYKPRIPNIVWPKVIDVKVSIPDITQIAEDIKVLRQNVCPTCGRSFEC